VASSSGFAAPALLPFAPADRRSGRKSGSVRVSDGLAAESAAEDFTAFLYDTGDYGHLGYSG
jgi:hypothetical protein